MKPKLSPGCASFLAIGLYTIAPILSVLACATIAKVMGCQVHEGGGVPCKCLGVDIGPLLYLLGVMGWMALVTVPTGLIGMVIFGVVSLLGVGSSKRSTSEFDTDQASPSTESNSPENTDDAQETE